MIPRNRNVVALAILGVLGPAVGGAYAEPQEMETVYYDELDANGNLSGGVTSLPLPIGGAFPCSTPPTSSTTIEGNGPATKRIDFVFVGDGYLATELGDYADDVDAALTNLTAQEPFLTYRTFFNFYRVDVVSNESGVDNELGCELNIPPTCMRDTAMDMGFDCQGIQRLLCVNGSTAYCFANNAFFNNAPEADHVLAVANTPDYGGAAFGSNLVTFSGGNSDGPEIAIHELGHSLGGLADEYNAPGGTYHGDELPEPNVSILEAAAMFAAGTKWADWLGVNDPDFGGRVKTYEGAAHHDFNIFRPTFVSKMRLLDYPFNLPSVESLIIEIYMHDDVDPIDAHTPTGPILDGSETIMVTPLVPEDSLDVQWFLDGSPIPGATGTTLDLSALGLTSNSLLHFVDVTVVDSTDLVRDEAARDLYMSQTETWTVVVP